MLAPYVLVTIMCFVKDSHWWTVGQHYVDCRVGRYRVVGWLLFGVQRGGIKAVDVTWVGKGPVIEFWLPR